MRISTSLLLSSRYDDQLGTDIVSKLVFVALQSPKIQMIAFLFNTSNLFSALSRRKGLPLIGAQQHSIKYGINNGSCLVYTVVLMRCKRSAFLFIIE